MSDVVLRKETIAQAARESGFHCIESCCNTELKYCNGDQWIGNLEAFAETLLRLNAAARESDHA